MALDSQEFEFPDDIEVEGNSTMEELDLGNEQLNKSDDIQIEVEDDTPAPDKNVTPLPQEIKNELDADDLSGYSKKVKERFAQLRKAYHDERREKETAARERAEAIRYAQALQARSQQLQQTLSVGEETYVTTLKKSAETEVAMAKRAYKEAYDSGDSDRLVEAQAALNEAQLKLASAQNYQPQYKQALQQQEIPVEIQPSQAQAPKPDQKAAAWQARNEWFGDDTEMTSLALGLHEKLVKSGVDPTSDEYYRRIDDTMRKRFPEHDWGDTLEEQPTQRTQKPSTVVAPASRSTAPKKVRLTQTQLAFAKKLGVTPEQYAREMIKLEKR